MSFVSLQLVVNVIAMIATMGPTTSRLSTFAHWRVSFVTSGSFAAELAASFLDTFWDRSFGIF
jgi:hypothetical protein